MKPYLLISLLDGTMHGYEQLIDSITLDAEAKYVCHCGTTFVLSFPQAQLSSIMLVPSTDDQLAALDNAKFIACSF